MLRWLQLTDHHVGRDAAAVNRGYATSWALDRVLTAIAAAGGHGADFLLCTGDLVDLGEDEAYAHACALYGVAPAGRPPGPLTIARPGLAGLPAYFVPGNHDPRAAWTRNLFPEGEGAERMHLAWTVGDLQFVFVDQGNGGRAGSLDEEGLAFLDRALAGGRPTVLVLHHHPVAVGIPWLDAALPEGVERLWAVAARGRVVGVLFGHAHLSVERRVDGIPVLGLRSTSFQFGGVERPTFLIQPLQYRLLTYDERGLRSELFEVPLTGPAEAVPVP